MSCPVCKRRFPWRERVNMWQDASARRAHKRVNLEGLSSDARCTLEVENAYVTTCAHVLLVCVRRCDVERLVRSATRAHARVCYASERQPASSLITKTAPCTPQHPSPPPHAPPSPPFPPRLASEIASLATALAATTTVVWARALVQAQAARGCLRGKGRAGGLRLVGCANFFLVFEAVLLWCSWLCCLCWLWWWWCRRRWWR